MICNNTRQNSTKVKCARYKPQCDATFPCQRFTERCSPLSSVQALNSEDVTLRGEPPLPFGNREGSVGGLFPRGRSKRGSLQMLLDAGMGLSVSSFDEGGQGFYLMRNPISESGQCYFERLCMCLCISLCT